MVLAQAEQNHQAGNVRDDHRPTIHYFAEDDEEKQASIGLNLLVQRNTGGAQWTWRKDTVAVDSGAAENAMPKSMFPEIRKDPRMGKRFKGPGGEHIKNYGQQVMSVRTPKGVVRKRTWQVADVRRHFCVGISDHPSQKRPVHREE